MLSMIPYRMLNNLSGARTGWLNDPFFRSFMDMSSGAMNSFRVDIRERDNSYLLDAELPGIPKDKIQLTVDKDVLTISADIESEKSSQHENYCYSERRAGHVQRSFNLEGIDADAITASYRDGMLYVNLPKAKPIPEKSSRTIEIGETPVLEEAEKSA